MLERVWVGTSAASCIGGRNEHAQDSVGAREIQNDFNQDHQGVDVKIDIITIKTNKVLSL